MADRSLAAMRLVDKDILSIAQILEANLQYLRDRRSILEKEYIMEIKIAVGLGCIAALMRGNYTYGCQFNAFLKCDDCGQQEEFCSCAAHMMKLAHELFPGTGCSRYHQDFFASMDKVLDNACSTMMGKGKEAKRLLSIFSQSSRRGW